MMGGGSTRCRSRRLAGSGRWSPARTSRSASPPRADSPRTPAATRLKGRAGNRVTKGGGIDLDRVCDDQGCISLNAFASKINQTLESQAVGYVSIVGALAHIKEYGQARTSADAEAKPMKAELPMNEASVSKLLTTI